MLSSVCCMQNNYFVLNTQKIYTNIVVCHGSIAVCLNNTLNGTMDSCNDTHCICDEGYSPPVCCECDSGFINVDGKCKCKNKLNRNAGLTVKQ